MLPHALSTDLTSLNQDCDRRAVIVEFDVDPRGEVGTSDVYLARVRNRAKLAYPSVAAWLEKGGPLPPAAAAEPALAEQIRLQDDIAQRLEERRIEAGALDFDTRTPVAVYADGHVTGIVETGHDRATKLIENFMIAANGVVARFLAAFGPVIQRVVRRPKNWPRLREVAAELGERLPKEPDGVALSRFLAKRRAAAPEAYRDLSLVVIKLLGRGEYVVDGGHGHFGLAVSDYSHSTAPNRRLSDLVTQRLILAALGRRARPYTAEELRDVALRCSEKEQDADKVERHVRKCAAALFLQHRIGERFPAVVTGDSEKGTWVRIKHPPIEGRLVREPGHARVGDRLRVDLVHVDVERGYIDFRPA
jgi:exoribonuclease-2